MHDDGQVPPGSPTAAALDMATATYAEHREVLFAIVYNLLGTVADTEDVLQDTWLSWATARRQDVGNPRAYLLRIAINGALARLHRAQRDRENYVGPWLPEPLVTAGVADAADAADHAESVSLALLVVLQTLTPLERAVFVLRESFGYNHVEIAEMLGRSPAAIRQVGHRAREHVQARRPRFRSDPGTHRKVTDRFLSAALGGDLATLMEVLAPDVALWTDGGGKQRAALRVIEGRDKTMRLITQGLRLAPPDLTYRYAYVNGDPGILALRGDTVYGAVVVDLDLAGDRIRRIYAVLNPDKLPRSITGS